MRFRLIFAIVLILNLGWIGEVDAAGPQFVIVGGLGQNSTIAIYKFDDQAGTLTLDSSLQNYQAPNWLTWRPKSQPASIVVGNRKKGTNGTSRLTGVIYQTVKNADGSVSAQLTNAASAYVETVDPAHLLVHKSSKWVVVASTTNNSVAVVPLQLPNPSLGTQFSFGTPTIYPVEDSGVFVHETVFSPDYKYVYAVCRDSDWVRMYNFNQDTGVLTFNGPNEGKATLPKGSGPHHLAIHPFLPVAYVINTLSSTIAKFDWDKSTGLLSADFEKEPGRIITTLPPNLPPPSTNCTANNTAACPVNALAEVMVSPDGDFVYAANRGLREGSVNNIAIFSVDTTNGNLFPIAWEDGGGDIVYPRHMSFSPGKAASFVFVANENGNSVTVFKRDQLTGLLTKTHTISTVALIDRPSFAAVMHPNTKY